MEETLAHIVKKFNVDLGQPSPIALPIGRFKDLPRLYHELGFKVGAEIGVYTGEYSRNLLRYNPDSKLYGVDLWDDYEGYDDFKPYKDISLPRIYEDALANVAGFGDRCEMIRGWSNDPKILDRFPDGSLDYVFIDGNHQYEWVVWDIFNWSKKVKKGGIVSGHDYDDWSKSRSRWYQINVINAVDGWCKSNRISPLFLTSNNQRTSWFYVKE